MPPQYKYRIDIDGEYVRKPKSCLYIKKPSRKELLLKKVKIFINLLKRDQYWRDAVFYAALFFMLLGLGVLN